jgi:hypothetical protein
MTDPNTNTNAPAEPEARGFPYLTVIATVATLFLFVGLIAIAYNSPNYLSDTKPAEPKADPATKLGEVRAKNQAILDGNPNAGAKMSVQAATAELLGKLRSEKDTLPFPMPEPPVTEAKVPELKKTN